MHSHGVEVLDRAHHDGVVGSVAHDFEFEFLPTQNRLFEQDLGNRTRLQRLPHHIVEFLAVVEHPAPFTAEGEAGTHDQRIAEAVDDLASFFERRRDTALRDVETDLFHR